MPHAQNSNEIYKICFKMITENKITLEEIVGKITLILYISESLRIKIRKLAY